jgi:hypothetical protein
MIPLIYPALTTIVSAFLFNCVSRFGIFLGFATTEGRRTIRCRAAHSAARLRLRTCLDESVVGTEPRNLQHPFECRQTDARDCAVAFSWRLPSGILVVPVMPVVPMMAVMPVMLRANCAAANPSGSIRRVGVRIGDAIIDAAH